MHYEGQEFRVGQGNNVFIFRGVGLAAIVSQIREITPDIFTTAAFALAECVSEVDLARGRLSAHSRAAQHLGARGDGGAQRHSAAGSFPSADRSGSAAAYPQSHVWSRSICPIAGYDGCKLALTAEGGHGHPFLLPELSAAQRSQCPALLRQAVSCHCWLTWPM